MHRVVYIRIVWQISCRFATQYRYTRRMFEDYCVHIPVYIENITTPVYIYKIETSLHTHTHTHYIHTPCVPRPRRNMCWRDLYVRMHLFSIYMYKNLFFFHTQPCVTRPRRTTCVGGMDVYECVDLYGIHLYQ